MSTELADLGGDGHQRVGGRLMRKVIKFVGGDVQARASSRLNPGDPEQQFVQLR